MINWDFINKPLIVLANWRSFVLGKIKTNGQGSIDGELLQLALTSLADNLEVRAAWFPVFALVARGDDLVLKVIDWQGSSDAFIPKPAINVYVGPGGLTGDLNAAVNVRGLGGSVNLDAMNNVLTMPGRAGVGIGNGNNPATSAAFEVRSTSGGILFPRMTQGQRDAIPSPLDGLYLYVTDGTTPGFFSRIGSVWRRFLVTATGYTTLIEGALSINDRLFFPQSIANRRIVFFDRGDNSEHTFYGMGLNSSALRFQIDGSGASYIFYTSVDSTSSKELMRLTGTGLLGLGAAVPTATLHVNGATGYNQFRLEKSYTPTGSSDANGSVGDICFDDNYGYRKCATGGWKRWALNTF